MPSYINYNLNNGSHDPNLICGDATNLEYFLLGFFFDPEDGDNMFL
jgi:hypothetical protein